ncbi:MAG: DUF1622 domain-containing protein [Candidatus Omnitrophota bacterium]
MVILHAFIGSLGLGLSIIGAFIIIWGVFICFYLFLKNELTQKEKAQQLNEMVRIKLGGYLVLSLEFFIASDIIKTIVTPSWEGLGILGAIVVIRTVLTYFLGKDLKKI